MSYVCLTAIKGGSKIAKFVKMRKLMTEKPNVWTDDRLEGLKSFGPRACQFRRLAKHLVCHGIPSPEKRIEWDCLNVHHQSVVQGLKGQKLWCLRCPSHCPCALNCVSLSGHVINAVGQPVTPRKMGFCSVVNQSFRVNPTA